MRVSLVAATLAVVLTASALNLGLGAVWVAAVAAATLLRRRVRFAVELVLVLVMGAGVGGFRAGWFAAPAPRSYTADEASWLLERLGFTRISTGATPSAEGTDQATSGAALRARLRERRREELRYTAADLERRAAAGVALSRNLRRLRGRAAGEVATLEAAVRRLALTLTSPEFRDLEDRRARLQAWFAHLEARLAAARDETEVESVARALEPAAMATVSLRAIREDLARVEAGARELLRVLSGGDVSVTATAAVGYDTGRGEILLEDRYAFAVEPPLRIERLDAGALGQGGTAAGRVQALSYEAGGATPRELPASGEIAIEPGRGRVIVVDRRVRQVTTVPVRSLLKPIAFGRLLVDRGGNPSGEFLVTVTLDGLGGSGPVLTVPVPSPRLERVTFPRYALHYVSLPGSLRTTETHDLWVPAPVEMADGLADPPARMVIEVVPATVFLRNGAFAGSKAYLYEPNLAATLTLTGLAALTGVLAGRRHPDGASGSP